MTSPASTVALMCSTEGCYPDTWAGLQLASSRVVIVVPGWSSSNRRQDLPSNWPALRQKRFKLDGYRCTWTNPYGERCVEPAEECDHIGERTDHRIEKLRSLCEYHHGQKSGREGAEARARQWRKNNSKFRRSEQHPGML